MEPARVLICDMSPMLREIIKELLAAQPDITVVGECGSVAALGSDIDSTRAGVLIIGNDRPEVSHACRDLLRQRPQLKVLVVAGDGRRTSLLEARPQELPLGELSPERLVEAVRTTVETIPDR